MKGILIDPHNELVTDVNVGPSIRDWYELMGCGCLDRRDLGANIDLWVDDEGLLHMDQRYFSLRIPGDLSAVPLMAGKSLVLMHDGEGNSVGLHPSLTAARFAQVVEWWGDAWAAERAILAGWLQRPISSVNGEIIWQWTANEVQPAHG